MPAINSRETCQAVLGLRRTGSKAHYDHPGPLQARRWGSAGSKLLCTTFPSYGGLAVGVRVPLLKSQDGA
jgi:hypothetical protein